VVASEFDLQLTSGRVHAKRHGAVDARLVIAVPGLSANLMSFEFLAESLDPATVQLVSVDLRGRGLSDATAPGSYGWVNHAADIFEIADRLGADSFSVVGHSMGAAVAMAAAAQNATRIDRMVLVDLCGVPDAATAMPIGASLARLGAVYPSVDAFIDLMRGIGVIEPWSTYWDGYFRYELQMADGGVASRTSRAAVMEDVTFGAGAFAFGDRAGVYGLWPSLTMPVLLLRATREMVPGTGFILTQRDRDRFPEMVSGAIVVDIDANHYTIATNGAAATAIARFLGTGG
jgi:pimeloyl-ACP methyl ester carboxylesterase